MAEYIIFEAAQALASAAETECAHCFYLKQKADFCGLLYLGLKR
jgi:hypothetical protein